MTHPRGNVATGPSSSPNAGVKRSRQSSLESDGSPPKFTSQDTSAPTCDRKSDLTFARCGQIRVGDAVEFDLKLKTGCVAQRGLVCNILHIHKVHVQFLRESTFGRPGELLLDDLQCKDIATTRIRHKLRFTSGSLAPSGRFFTNFVYSPSKDFCLRGRTPNVACDACHRKVHIGNREQVDLLPYGMRFGGITYHDGDLVGLDPLLTGQPWILGQIRHLPRRRGDSAAAISVTVALFGRCSDLQGNLGYVSEKRLFLTSDIKTFAVSRLLRKFTLLEHEPCVDEDCTIPTFFATHMLPPNARAHVENLLPLQPQFAMCLRCQPPGPSEWVGVKKPHMIDLFSGGGGAVQAATKHFRPLIACEVDKVAAKSLRLNHPATKVYGTEMQNLIKHPEALPQPGKLYLLTAGPPCQDHSGANRHAIDDSERSNLLFHTLDLVGYLKPAVVLIENVPNLKRFKSGFQHGEAEGYAATSSFAVAGIRRLLSMGYQTRLGVLNSRSYGSAQSRSRLFILAARSGLPLPGFPLPTHANPDIRATVFDAEGGDARGFYIGDGTPGIAPYPAVTVREAIGDLPEFEYALPGMQSRIQAFNPLSTGLKNTDTRIGFSDEHVYATAPRNDFQRRLRGGKDGAVHDQYTAHQSQRELDLMVQAFKSDNQPGNARRVNPEGGFKTVMTDIGLGGRCSDVVHYSVCSQRRVLTVAELKRAMGLPDSYRLAGTVKEKIKQLGNMIDIHVLHAIHASILQTITPNIYEAWLAGQAESNGASQ